MALAIVPNRSDCPVLFRKMPGVPSTVAHMWFQQVEIPDDLVSAARDGRLAIFVGAGASRDAPSLLPDFEGLVTDIGTQAGSPPTKEQLERPDVFLGDLVDLKVDVHSLVARAINAPGSTPNRLHHAIMSLAAAHPPLRVVTTNYDHHLEAASRADGLDPEVFRAPALPIGDDFTGVIHLHGALGQDPRQLVVTDADFGHAYLREAGRPGSWSECSLPSRSYSSATATATS